MRVHTQIDLAAELIARVLRFDGPADAVVARFCRERPALGQRDRRQLGDAVFALLRRKRALDLLAARPGPGTPSRRLALLALAAADDFPHTALAPEEAAWLAACPASDAPDLPPECRHNLPDWLAARLLDQLGRDEFDALTAALLQPAPLDVRVNTAQAKRDAAQRVLAEQGVDCTPTPYSPWGLRVRGKPDLQRSASYRSGAIEVQDEGSQLIAWLTGARRGEVVADYCAGAGGKTLALAAMMRGAGRIYAFDTAAQRLQALKERAHRARVTMVYPAAIRGADDPLLARLAGKVDRVLVDAPCSGLGTLRRSPDLKWRQTPETVAAFAAQQRAVLAEAARLVKRGGTLVYATCSVLAEEDEAIAQDFGAAHAEFAAQPVAALLQPRLGDDVARSLTGSDGAYLRLWPHRHATDGFFGAVWQRTR